VRIIRSLPAIIAAILITAIPLPSLAQFTVGVGFTIGSPPPPLPVYSMPPAPYPNYQWTPGYWAWGQAGYYWVPGVWVAPPAVGLLWTPGYWGYSGGNYGWNGGYWGASVGFYGGVNYGFGYPGTGFYGGTWSGGNFNYNTAVVNVNRTVIHNTYNRTVINNYNTNRVSYNGGHGGVTARPTTAQIDARRTGRVPTTAQVQTAKVAGQDRNLYANVNKGKPPVTASSKPLTDPKQLPKYAPVTTADKQAAQASMKGTSANKAPTTMNKAPTTTNKAPTTTNKMAPEHKAPTTANKAPTTTQKQPPAQPAHKQPPASNTMSSAHHKPANSMQAQPMHKQPPSGAMHSQGSMHQGGQRPPPGGGQAHPNGGGQRPPGGGQAHPNGGGGQGKNKPPRG